MFGLSSEREFDLGLFDHGIDAAQPIGRDVGHCIEPAQRILKVRQRLAVGPTALGFLGCKDRAIYRLFGVIAAAEMQRQ